MAILNYGRNMAALAFGGSISVYPSAIAIGIGSTTIALTDTTLTTITGCQALTSTTYPAYNKVQFIADYNSVYMSGVNLTEFGLKSGASLTGSMITKSIIPALEFDGTNELRVELITEFY